LTWYAKPIAWFKRAQYSESVHSGRYVLHKRLFNEIPDSTGRVDIDMLYNKKNNIYSTPYLVGCIDVASLYDFGNCPNVVFYFHFIFLPLNLFISNLRNSFSSGVSIITSSAECARQVA